MIATLLLILAWIINPLGGLFATIFMLLWQGTVLLAKMLWWGMTLPFRLFRRS